MHRKARDPLEAINRLAAELGLFRTVVQPRMRYFTLGKGDPRRFCWTTEKTSDGFYHALLYRVRKNGTWVLKKQRPFKHRASAKRCARTWMEKQKGLGKVN